MRDISVDIEYIPACNEDQDFGAFSANSGTPARWGVLVHCVDDNNAMSGSVQCFIFVCKPTRKQVRTSIRNGIKQHAAKLLQFKQDYPHYFK